MAAFIAAARAPRTEDRGEAREDGGGGVRAERCRVWDPRPRDVSVALAKETTGGASAPTPNANAHLILAAILHHSTSAGATDIPAAAARRAASPPPLSRVKRAVPAAGSHADHAIARHAAPPGDPGSASATAASAHANQRAAVAATGLSVARYAHEPKPPAADVTTDARPTSSHAAAGPSGASNASTQRSAPCAALYPTFGAPRDEDSARTATRAPRVARTVAATFSGETSGARARAAAARERREDDPGNTAERAVRTRRGRGFGYRAC